MKNVLSTLTLASLGFVAGASAQTSVSSNITTNTTWGSGGNPSPIILEGVIFVNNGATLTILPGTIIRGQPRTAAVTPGVTTGSPGALVITQNGRLVANGTSTNPIIFTTAAVDNDNNGVADDDDVNGFKDAWVSGDTFLDDSPLTAPLAPLDLAGNGNVALWGGVVILGQAPTNNANKAGVGYGLATVEGLTVPGFPAADATYGGVSPHDNSGSLKYVSIRHAGDEIGNSNELNGLTLAGVGDGTVLENIEIYCNFDDGIEWFGGTVNGKKLAVFFAGDDAFDLDEGYTGVNQFCFGIAAFFKENDNGNYGSASGDKLGEFDGDNYRPDAVALQDNVNVRRDVTDTVFDETPWPLSNTSMWNATLIGNTLPGSPTFTPSFVPGTKRGIQFRNGFAGMVFNSIVVNTGAETGIEVSSDTSGAPGFNVSNNNTAGLVALVSSTLHDGAAFASGETTASSNGNTLATALGGTANVVNSGTAGSLTVEDISFNPTGNASGKLDSTLKVSKINPRPAFSLTGLTGGVPPQGPNLESATYRGAFNRTATTLWTTGWTALNKAGLLAD